MTRIARLAAAAALLGGVAAGGVAVAQDGPMDGPMMEPGRHGLDFAAIDIDGNGMLSRSELQARAVARLSKADTNGDGFLDRDELIAALPGAHGALFFVFGADPAAGFADRMLAMMGATEAGKVEVAALADHRVNMLLTFADTDRDAAISKAEADALSARHKDWTGRHRDMRGGMPRGMGDRDGDGGGGPAAAPQEPPHE